MKKRIQRIVLLALLANLGIVAFQIYWLRNTYKVNEVRFEKDVNEALNLAIEHLVVDHFRDNIVIKHVKNENDTIDFSNVNMVTSTTTIVDSNLSIAFIGANELNQEKIEAQKSIRLIKKNITISDSTKVKVEELLNKTLTSLSDYSIDLTHLDTLYHIELQQRGISLPYFLEYYRADTLYDSTIGENDFEISYQTNTIAGFLGNQPSVKANFPNRTLFLFQQMSFNILASLLLLIITTASFIYMIRIIFEQKKLSDIKNDFINNMTHELKTPISILSAANEAMTNFNILENQNKTQQYLGIFKNEIERLSGMVEKVLNIAIYEKSTFKLKLELTNIEELLEDLTNRYEIIPHKDIKIDYENQLINPVLSLDKVHFTNILNNLLDNAIKYSKDQIQIVIKSFEDAKNIVIQISDNGMGIAKSHQERIFDKFYRVPTGDLHKVKGFGLGLSYVRKMVEKHGGQIEVHSELNQGSMFTIRLPK